MLRIVQSGISSAKLALALIAGLAVAACNSSSSDDTSAPAVELPGKVVSVSVDAGDQRAVFTVGTPTDGGPVYFFTVTCTATDEADVSAFSAVSPVTLSGFVNDVSYSCVVEAENSSGAGPASDPLTVITADPFQETDCTTQTTDGDNITCLAHNVLAGMSDTLRGTVLRALVESNATNFWTENPVTTNARLGLRFSSLSDDQLTDVEALIAGFLSDDGEALFEGIRAADEFLGTTLTGYGADQYNISFHGIPSYDEPWMIQVTGHNYTVHVAIDGDYISMTPNFVGVEPTSFTQDSVDYAPMAARQTALAAMLDGLTAGELTSAETASTFDDVVLGPGEDNAYPDPSIGLDVSTLTAAQRDLVIAAITSFTNDQEGGELSAVYTTDAALDDTFISWSTDADLAAQGGYVRIDGPRVWIEFVVVAGDATSEVNYHSIWRDKSLDYGGNFDLTD